MITGVLRLSKHSIASSQHFALIIYASVQMNDGVVLLVLEDTVLKAFGDQVKTEFKVGKAAFLM